MRDLKPLSEQRHIILVGGQAVAFWAAFFELEKAAKEEKLFTSKDIDFEGAARSVRKAGELLGGEVRLATIDDHTPNTGVVLFKDSDGEERTADFLSAPYGLDARDVRDSALKITVPNPDDSEQVPVWIMHPERCMESRVYNVVGLKQSGQIAMDQLKHDRSFRTVYLDHGVDPFEAVLVDGRLPGNFLEKRHPQMVGQLEERRKRSRVQRERRQKRKASS